MNMDERKLMKMDGKKKIDEHLIKIDEGEN